MQILLLNAKIGIFQLLWQEVHLAAKWNNGFLKSFFYDERNQLRKSDLKIISYLEKLIDENALLKRIKQGKTHQMIKKK
jgi:hypothetical protein